MKLNFTKIVFVCLALFSFTWLNAQNINRLVVTSNGNDTDFAFGLAGFGDIATEVSAEGVVAIDATDPVNDGCEAITNDIAGSVVIIDRGTCAFVDKARNAQAAGAAAVIICNSRLDPTTGDDISDQIIVPGVGMDDMGDDITILVAGISFNDCALLRTLIDDGATISFSFFCPTPTYGPEVVWGANGEGSFNGGLNGWSTDKGTGLSLDDGGWFFDPTASLERGAFGNGVAGTPTACDGIMLFDTDFYDNGGEVDLADGNPANFSGFGDGVCPVNDDAGNEFGTCDGLLISPTIDLTALPGESYELEWSQTVRPFNNSQFFILLSDDGGATFRDTVQINDELIPPFASGNITTNDTRTIPLCGFENASELRVAFLYQGAYYFWALDDILIRSIDTSVDLQANPFFSTYPNFVTPSSQVDEAAFIIDVENLENGTATNSSVLVEIINLDNLQTVYTDTQDYPDIGCLVLDENRFFEERFTGDLEDGRYRILYTVQTDADADPTNNTQSWDFEIGGNTFRKLDRDVAALVGISAANIPFYSIGQYYRTPNGAGWAVDEVRFGISDPRFDGAGNPTAVTDFNLIIEFELSLWRDLNNDFAVDGDERVLVGSASRIVSSSQPEDYSDLLVELENVNDVTQDIALVDDGNYVLMANFRPLDPAAAPIGTLAVAGADLRFNYGGTAFAFQQQFGEFRGGGYLFATGIDGDEADRRYTPASNFTVYMPMTIRPLATDTEDLLNDQSISVFPNPVSENLFVNMDLNNSNTDINLELVDVQGRTILSQNFNSTSGNLELNVSEVPAGIYSLNVRTEDGLTSKKVIIQ